MKFIPTIGDEHMRALGMGLSGVSYKDKVAVARQLQENNACPYIDASSLDGTDFETGLEFLTERYHHYHGVFVTDLTPIDLAAQAICIWSADESWLQDFVSRCIGTTNRYFFHVGIIQPPKLGTMSNEVINTTIIGLCSGHEAKFTHNILHRSVADTANRVSHLTKSYSAEITHYRAVLGTVLNVQ